MIALCRCAGINTNCRWRPAGRSILCTSGYKCRHNAICVCAYSKSQILHDDTYLSGIDRLLSMYAKQRIVALRGQAMTNSDFARCLANEGILVRRKTVLAFLQRYKQTNTVCRMSESGRPSKATGQAVLSLAEGQMQKDNKTTASSSSREKQCATYHASQ